MFSGSTAVVVLMQNNMAICANAGDSRAIIGSQNQAGIWFSTPLSRDHKPDEPDEALRVKKQNGRIEQSRIGPGMVGYAGASNPQFFGPKRVWLKNK